MSAARDAVEQFSRSVIDPADWPVAWTIYAIDSQRAKLGDWTEQGVADTPATLFEALWKAALARTSLFTGITSIRAIVTLARPHSVTKKPVTTQKEWLMDGASEAALQRAEEEKARTALVVHPTVLAPVPATAVPTHAVATDHIGVLTMQITHQNSVITWLYSLVDRLQNIIITRESAIAAREGAAFERMAGAMDRERTIHVKREGEMQQTIERLLSEAVAEAKKVRDALLEVDKQRLEEMRIRESNATKREMIDAVKPAIPVVFRGLAAKVGLDVKIDEEEDDAEAPDDKPADVYAGLDAALADVAATLKDPVTKMVIQQAKEKGGDLAAPLVAKLAKLEAAYAAVVADKEAADKAAAEKAEAARASNSTGTAQA